MKDKIGFNLTCIDGETLVKTKNQYKKISKIKKDKRALALDALPNKLELIKVANVLNGHH